LLVVACRTGDPNVKAADGTAAANVQEINSAEQAPVLTTVDGVPVPRSGWGSALALVPGSSRDFYLLTDRGPNVDGPNSLTKLFPAQSYSPRIYRAHIDGSQLRLDGFIELKRPDGTMLTGVPIPTGQCPGTVESAQTLTGAVIPPDPFGVDSEGLVAQRDGTFWVSDEYGPFIVHFGPDGRELQRLSPCNGGLPSVYKLRRPNRGMEGLTMTPDGQWLVGIMQAPLENPSSAGVRNVSTATRILFRNAATGATREYVYLLDAPAMLNSEIMALSATRFLVLERDDFFPAGSPPATVKRIYEIDITGATDVSTQGALGATPVGGAKTLEQATVAELVATVKPVSKKLTIDLLALGYAHDKPEGLALASGGMLLVANDDDFGIVAKTGGGVTQKILPLTRQRDAVQLWRIKLP
jgi:hypothetical protein